jgi:hypothetical protein
MISKQEDAAQRKREEQLEELARELHNAPRSPSADAMRSESQNIDR